MKLLNFCKKQKHRSSTTTNYKEAVTKAINLGGDTDTIGSITDAVAALIYGADSIPKKWKNKIAHKKDINQLLQSIKTNY